MLNKQFKRRRLNVILVGDVIQAKLRFFKHSKFKVMKQKEKNIKELKNITEGFPN